MKNRHSIKFKKTASYVAIAVLVAIGLAVLISAIALRINGWFGLIITNFCTVMICWAVFQFWAKISDEQRKDDYSDLKAEEEKDRRLKDAEKEIQKITDNFTKEIDTICDAKQKEVMSI